MQSGVDPNCAWYGGDTPLHLAIDSEIDWGDTGRCPEFRVVLALLEHGANPNVINFRGRSPLDFAMAHPEAFKILIAHGAKYGKDLPGEIRYFQ